MTLAKLVHPNMTTPQSTLSDKSYIEEEEASADSENEDQSTTRKTRSHSEPSPAKQLEDKLNKLKFGK